MKIIYNLLMTIGKVMLGIVNLVSILTLVTAIYFLYAITSILWLFQGGYMNMTFWEVILDMFEELKLKKNKQV